MKQLYICSKSESLDCFISRAHGLICNHATPHELTMECADEVCIKTSQKYFLRGCSCRETEEENDI